MEVATRKADLKRPVRTDWTSAANGAVVSVRARHEARQTPRAKRHCGVVLVTAEAVDARGDHHGKAYRYPKDRFVPGGGAR
jgi:hypothetical protein